MALLTEADFRQANPHEVCVGITLDDTEAEATKLTATIARMQAKLNEHTNDLWEPEAALVVVTQGHGGSRLYLSRRCTAVSQVRIRDEAGTWTVQNAAIYRLKSSLYSSGSKRVPNEDFDWLDIVLGSDGITGYPSTHTDVWAWPTEAGSVEVTGTFGWTTAPADIKRALALMVYHHFKAIRGDLRLITRSTTADQQTDFALTDPTGIPEADEIIEAYHRDNFMGVG